MKTTQTIFMLLLIFLSNPLLADPIDSLTNLLDKNASTSNLEKVIQLKMALASSLIDEKNNEGAIIQLQQSLKLAEQKGLKQYQFDILLQLGGLFSDIQDYPKTIETLKKLLQNHQPLPSKIQIETFGKIANAYRRMGNFELAYEYQLDALKEAEKIKDSLLIAKSLYQIGNVFFFQNNYEVAIDYYKQTLEICKLSKSDRGIFNSYGAIGGAYNRMNEAEEALKYNFLSLELAKKMNYKIGVAYATHNLAISHSLLGKYEAALDFYNQSLEIKMQSNDKWGIIATYRGIGDIYTNLEDFPKALEHYNQALELSKEINSKVRLLETYLSFAKYHRATGEFEKSTDFLFGAIDMKDTLINETTLQKMSDARTRFEIEEKEEDLLQKDQELKSLYVYALVGTTILLLLLLWALYSRYRSQIAHNNALKLKNEKIEDQHSELSVAYETQAMAAEQIAQQNLQLELTNNELKRFAHIASHDLKEPLRTIGSYTSLLKRRYKNKFDQDADEFLDFITQGVDKMYNLLNDVLDYSKLEAAQGNYDPIDSEKTANEVVESLNQLIQDKGAEILVDKLPEINIQKSHFIQIIQNLLVNALKFTNGKAPEIKIGYIRNGNSNVFFVKDNGIGFDLKYQDKIFQIFQRLNGKNEFEGTGVGLAICKKLVEQYGGEIWADSIPGQGSTFYFSLPMKVENMQEVI